MNTLRLLSAALTFFLGVSLAISANAATGESYVSEGQSIKFVAEHAGHTSPQVSTTKQVPDEVLLFGAAVIGLIGITIMRKTLH